MVSPGVRLPDIRVLTGMSTWPLRYISPADPDQPLVVVDLLPGSVVAAEDKDDSTIPGAVAAAGEGVTNSPREIQPDHSVPAYCRQVVLGYVTRFDSAIALQT